MAKICDKGQYSVYVLNKILRSIHTTIDQFVMMPTNIIMYVMASKTNNLPRLLIAEHAQLRLDSTPCVSGTLINCLTFGQSIDVTV